MHGIGTVQDRKIPIQLEPVIRRTADLPHAEISRRYIVGKDDLILVPIKGPAELVTTSAPGEMFDQREERSFPVIECNVIDIIEHPWVRHTPKLCIGIAASKCNGNVGSMALQRVGETEGAIEIPWKWNGKGDQRWMDLLDVSPQAFQKKLIR